MAFITPMYASPLKPGFSFAPYTYAVEEKIDGIRLVTEVIDKPSTLFQDKTIFPWSRYGNYHDLPGHILADLCKFPACILDGEKYVPGLRSYGAADHDNRPDLIYAVFDILEIGGQQLLELSYLQRQHILADLDNRGYFDGSVQLVASTPVKDWNQVIEMRDEVWARDGEGLIVKDINSIYLSGKRPKNSWIKIKQLLSAVFEVIGFEPSRGLINNRGPFAMIKLRDPEGIVTSVKTRNDAMCRYFESRANTIPHPDIGRMARCEYQERTPDKEYRHIRFDRWEDE